MFGPFGLGTLMSFKPSRPSFSSFSFSCFLPLGIMDDWALSLNKSLKIHKDLTFIFCVPNVPNKQNSQIKKEEATLYLVFWFSISMIDKRKRKKTT
jgi:hypothetical protein